MQGNIRNQSEFLKESWGCRDQVHLWHADLDLPDTTLRKLFGMLSAEEWQRASRFVFAQDRRRFIASHGLLRTVLAGYLEMPPSSLRYYRQANGKPALMDCDGTGLCFNISHSRDKALFAVARDREVGVDIEFCRPFSGMHDLARRFFFQNEYATLQSLTPPEQVFYFYSLWTCKEAYIKVTGEGLAGLDCVEVQLPRDGGAASVSYGNSGMRPGDWELRRLVPPRGYVAALAVEGAGWELVEIPDARLTMDMQ
jgi:4'-phosphopantetheinyl transferase